MAKAKGFMSENTLKKEAFRQFGGDPDAQPATPPPQQTDTANKFREGRLEKIEQVSIFDIVPDLSQPRRTLPSQIRTEWNGDPNTLPALFDEWLDWVGDDIRAVIMAILDGEEIEMIEFEEPSISALAEIAFLAASIRRDGLMNPITLARGANGNQIESGERRWLAYHLLHHLYEKPWHLIPARIVDAVDRWRQAAENNIRKDLNAIGRVRQFAVLLMDLIGWEHFQPFEVFEFEQDFYAQVADAKAWRVPAGANEKLLTAMGMKNRAAVSRSRALLRLPRKVWIEADDQNLSEDVLLRFIRDGEDEIVATRNNDDGDGQNDSKNVATRNNSYKPPQELKELKRAANLISNEWQAGDKDQLRARMMELIAAAQKVLAKLDE
jgi:hypothetical protein